MSDLISRTEAISSLLNEANKEGAYGYIDSNQIFDLLYALPPAQQWIPVSERLPIKEFEEGRKNGTVYDLYPCFVTRYSTHTDKPRTRTYVCKSYFDGEDFMLHGGYAPNEESDTENTLAWMPIPEPYPTQSNDSNTLDAF